MRGAAFTRAKETVLRHPVLAFSAGFALLILALFADPLFLPRTFADRDLTRFFLPIEKAVHGSWRQGRMPLWLPEISFGRPLAANPNTGAFYPLRIAMAILPFKLSFKLFPILHLWLAAVGAFLLARLLGASGAGAALSGLTFALCGPALSDIAYPNILPGLAAMPYLIWAAGRFARRPTRRGGALFGLLWGLDLLAGDVFTAGLALSGALLLGWQEASAGRRLRVLRGLFLALVPGVFLAGIQVVPALLFTPYTVRALGRFPVKQSSLWSASLWRLAEFLIPFPFGNAAQDRLVWAEGLWSGKTAGFFNTFYAGAFAAAMFLWHRPGRGKRLFPYGLASLSLFLAGVGFYLPASLAEKASPLPLRYPEKLMVGVVLVLALVAGLALDGLRVKSGRRAAIIPAVAAVSLLGASLFCSGNRPWVERFADRHWSTMSHMGVFAAQRLPGLLFQGSVLWALLGALIFLAAPRGKVFSAAAIAFFVLIDLDTMRRSFLFTEPDGLVHSPSAAVRAVRRIVHPPAYGFLPLGDYISFPSPPDAFNRPYRLPPDEVRASLGSDAGAAFGIWYSLNNDYDMSDFYRVELVRREIYRDGGRWAGLGSYLAAYSARATIVPGGLLPNGFSTPARVLKPDWLLMNREALPTVRFAGDVLEVRDIKEAFEAVHSRRVILSKTTVVETGRSRNLSSGGQRITIVRLEPDRVELATEAVAPAMLVLARAFTPFRKVTVDGHPLLAFPADLCLTAVPVSAGRHRVLIAEELPGGAAGPALTLCGAILLVYLCRSRRGNEERPDARSPNAMD